MSAQGSSTERTESGDDGISSRPGSGSSVLRSGLSTGTSSSLPGSAGQVGRSRRTGIMSRGTDTTSDRYTKEGGHIAKEMQFIAFDCTNRGMLLLEDEMVKVKFTLGHLSLETVDIDRVKGKMSIELETSTGDMRVVVRLSWRMKFIVEWQGKKYRGHLLVESITKESLMNEIEPFPIGIYWFNDKSPEGIEYNQVTAICRSARCRERIRQCYKDTEKNVIKEFMPRFQKARTLDYCNQDGKKKGLFDLTHVSEEIVGAGVRSGTAGSRGNAFSPLTRARHHKKKHNRDMSPLRTGRAEHDEETGMALGEIGEYYGMAPSHNQTLQDFAFGGDAGSLDGGTSIGGGSVGSAGTLRTGGSMGGRSHRSRGDQSRASAGTGGERSLESGRASATGSRGGTAGGYLD